jgi:hypothetical protein
MCWPFWAYLDTARDRASGTLSDDLETWTEAYGAGRLLVAGDHGSLATIRLQ